MLRSLSMAFSNDLPDQPLQQTRDNNTLHTEPRAARLLETMIFAAARWTLPLSVLNQMFRFQIRTLMTLIAAVCLSIALLNWWATSQELAGDLEANLLYNHGPADVDANFDFILPEWLPNSPIRITTLDFVCLLYTSPSPRDATLSRMPSSA